MPTKQVAKKDETAMIFSEAKPDFMGDSERGQENVGIDDLTIPRLGLIQDLSPQRKKNDPAYIEGAEEGMLFNTVSHVLYGKSVLFVPVFYRKEFVIWKSQNSGGGYCGAYPTMKEARQEWDMQGYEGQIDKKGDPIYEILDTGQQFGILVDRTTGATEDIVISLSKSKRKIDRQLNTLIKMGGGDRFSRIYEISAVDDQNGAGQDFFNLSVRSLGFVTQELYDLGEKLYNAVSSGERGVDYEDAKPEDEEKEEY